MQRDAISLGLVMVTVIGAALLGRTMRVQQAREHLRELNARWEQLEAEREAGAAERWEREERALEELEDLAAETHAQCVEAWGEQECARRSEQIKQQLEMELELEGEP